MKTTTAILLSVACICLTAIICVTGKLEILYFIAGILFLLFMCGML